MAAGLVAHGGADFAAYRFHVDQVQVAVFLARGTDAQQRHLGGQHGGLDIRSAAQAAVAHAVEQQLFKARLDNGRLALVDHVDLGRRNIHAQHLVPTSGQTTGTDSAHITQSKDTDIHSSLSQGSAKADRDSQLNGIVDAADAQEKAAR
ncbi:hypothetical protein D3C79_715580 [compost metagenome]